LDRVLNSGFAGSFYPGGTEELEGLVKGLLHNECQSVENAVGMVVPHAGYTYSGRTAGRGFASAPDSVSTVVIVAPSHRYPLPGETVFDIAFMETPLGMCPVNTAVTHTMASEMDAVVFNEHSLEVMIPFIQVRWPEAQVVPVVLGNRPDCRKTAELIQRCVPDAFVIASSDLSHFYSLQVAKKLDRQAIDAFLSLSPERITSDIQACGRWAVKTLLFIAELRGAEKAVEIDYTTSADAGAGTEDVVGYFSGMVIR
jgi:AmmeMemoRadiSam system protein B